MGENNIINTYIIEKQYLYEMLGFQDRVFCRYFIVFRKYRYRKIEKGDSL
jgi:hypothetical protein